MADQSGVVFYSQTKVDEFAGNVGAVLERHCASGIRRDVTANRVDY